MRKFSGMILFLFVFIGTAAAEGRQFSADMITRTQEAGNMQGKLYVGGAEKVRVEIAPVATIVRYDRKVAWILMQNEQMYMEQPIDPKMVAQTTTDLPNQTDRQSLGPETVNGVATEKFLVKYSNSPGGQEESIYQWVGEGNFPVKTEDVNGTWSTEYQNIQEGLQPDDIFEVPAGYQKFAMPDMSELMNGGAAGAVIETS